jgi:hypothetical protein
MAGMVPVVVRDRPAALHGEARRSQGVVRVTPAAARGEARRAQGQGTGVPLW